MNNNLPFTLLLTNPVTDYWANLLTEVWVASIIESYYGPTKFMMNASNLDFSVWPNAKVVETLYKDIQHPIQSLCG